jgi:hypothetical protein
MSSTAYKIFVMQASEAGQVIQTELNNAGFFEDCAKPRWNWSFYYRIKLPEGWEYVIENGEIAFREPKKGENYLTKDYFTMICCVSKTEFINPIIKRKETKCT